MKKKHLTEKYLKIANLFIKDIPNLTAHAVVVYTIISNKTIAWDTTHSRISLRTLSAESGLSITGLKSALDILENRGWIKRYDTSQRGTMIEIFYEGVSCGVHSVLPQNTLCTSPKHGIKDNLLKKFKKTSRSSRQAGVKHKQENKINSDNDYLDSLDWESINVQEFAPSNIGAEASNVSTQEATEDKSLERNLFFVSKEKSSASKTQQSSNMDLPKYKALASSPLASSRLVNNTYNSTNPDFLKNPQESSSKLETKPIDLTLDNISLSELDFIDLTESKDVQLF